MKLIQKLRSARQRLPRLADSTFGVMVDASSLVSLSWCVLRMVAAQHVVKFSIRSRHTRLEPKIYRLSPYHLHCRSRIHYPCDDEAAKTLSCLLVRLQAVMQDLQFQQMAVMAIPRSAAPVTTSMKCNSCIELTAAQPNESVMGGCGCPSVLCAVSVQYMQESAAGQSSKA